MSSGLDLDHTHVRRAMAAVGLGHCSLHLGGSPPKVEIEGALPPASAIRFAAWATAGTETEVVTALVERGSILYISRSGVLFRSSAGEHRHERLTAAYQAFCRGLEAEVARIRVNSGDTALGGNKRSWIREWRGQAHLVCLRPFAEFDFFNRIGNLGDTLALYWAFLQDMAADRTRYAVVSCKKIGGSEREYAYLTPLNPDGSFSKAAVRAALRRARKELRHELVGA